MKHLLIILSTIFFTTAIFAQGTITVTTRLKGNSQPIQNAKVQISKNKKMVNTISTNQFGEASTTISNGTYALNISAPNMKTIHTENITVANNNVRKVFYLEPSNHPLDHKINDSKVFSTKDKKAVMIGGGRSKSITVAIEKEETKKVVATKSIKQKKAEKIPMDVLMETEKSELVFEPLAVAAVLPSAPPTVTPTISAGKLTTGEVNDFTKWNLFEEVSRTELEANLENWKFFMTRRYCVQAVNINNKPVLNATVHLLQDGKIIWTTKTDNTGKAELWNNINKRENSIKCQIQLIYENKTYTIENAKLFNDGINFIKVASECKFSNDVDIAFVVDATGSMGDEIQYLKAEINDVITRAQGTYAKLNINTSAVFYQDIGDAYVTKKNDFTNTLSNTTKFINEQFAAGGGDFPEAVDEALSVAIHELNWREDARTKIIFLVLDAPPHADEATQNRIYELTKTCAAKGIRIIPVSGSGINKNTEYIMRSIALATNGTYTFLTNNSGIGGEHLAPSTDSFKVEKMNDLLIRLITQFSFIPECDTKNADSINNDNPFNEWDVTHKINIYPNPTTGIFYIDIPIGSSEILLADISGKIIHRIVCDATSNKATIDISNYARGIYFARVLHNNKWLNGKLLLE